MLNWIVCQFKIFLPTRPYIASYESEQIVNLPDCNGVLSVLFSKFPLCFILGVEFHLLILAPELLTLLSITALMDCYADTNHLSYSY